MSDTPAKQASFEGWAVVEIMGHQQHIGMVTTEAYGPAVLFRIDSPGLPEREYTLTIPEYATVNGSDGNLRSWCPAGSKVKRPALPPCSVLVGPSSVYRITPCTEQAARQAIENNQGRPLILIEMPAKQIPAAELPYCLRCHQEIDECVCDDGPDPEADDEAASV